jgi:hypothetical protein
MKNIRGGLFAKWSKATILAYVYFAGALILHFVLDRLLYIFIQSDCTGGRATGLPNYFCTDRTQSESFEVLVYVLCISFVFVVGLSLFLALLSYLSSKGLNKSLHPVVATILTIIAGSIVVGLIYFIFASF